MVINVSVRSLVLNSKCITFFYIFCISIMDSVAIHVEIIDRNLGSSIRNILESDDIILKNKTQFF